MADMERRCMAVDLRSVMGESGARRLEGYAVVFGSLSEEMFGFREIIEPGAFRESLSTNPDVRALFNHDPSLVLGRTLNGTLALAEDMHGLRVAITLPDTSYARDVVTLVERGDVSQMSFAFSVRKNGETWATENGQLVRRLRALNLFDVSVVTFPAYAATTVAARAMEMASKTESDGRAATEIKESGCDKGRAAGVVAALQQSIDILRRR
jgi:HK97 family phage prohead protease